MEAKLTVVVLKGRVELMRPMDPAAINDHDDLFADFTEGCHHLMDILAQLLGVKMGHDLREDTRGAILDSPNHAEQDAAGDAAPGAIRQPRLAFERLFAFDVALAQGTGGPARALGAAPPAQPGEGKAPQDGFVFIEQNDLATTSLVLKGGKFERAVSEISRGGIKATSGTIGAYLLFFTTIRLKARIG